MKIPYKICQSCGDKFYKKDNQNLKKFLSPRKKFCSKECMFDSLKKHAGWNRGKHYSKETIKKMNFSGLEKGGISRKGKKFPNQSGKNHPNWKQKTLFLCPVCKKKKYLSPWELRRKYCSLTCRGLDKRGANSPVFKGENSSTKLRNRIRQMAEYTEWRLKCFRRDKFICTKCNNPKSKPLEVHHIESYSELKKKYRFNSPESARDCKKLWDISNGITLCRSCHRMTDSYAENLK